MTRWIAAALLVLAAVGQGIPGVDVVLKKKPGGRPQIIHTGADGTFKSGKLEAGTYSVTFLVPAAVANARKSYFESRSNYRVDLHGVDTVQRIDRNKDGSIRPNDPVWSKLRAKEPPKITLTRDDLTKGVELEIGVPGGSILSGALNAQ